MGGRGAVSKSGVSVTKKSDSAPKAPSGIKVSDTTFLSPIKNDSLLNLTWSDGDMFMGKGQRHRVIPQEIAKSITFYKNTVYRGQYTVAYKGIIVAEFDHRPKNQSETMRILHNIEHGFNANIEFYTD